MSGELTSIERQDASGCPLINLVQDYDLGCDCSGCIDGREVLDQIEHDIAIWWGADSAFEGDYNSLKHSIMAYGYDMWDAAVMIGSGQSE